MSSIQPPRSLSASSKRPRVEEPNGFQHESQHDNTRGDAFEPSTTSAASYAPQAALQPPGSRAAISPSQENEKFLSELQLAEETQTRIQPYIQTLKPIIEHVLAKQNETLTAALKNFLTQHRDFATFCLRFQQEEQRDLHTDLFVIFLEEWSKKEDPHNPISTHAFSDILGYLSCPSNAENQKLIKNFRHILQINNNWTLSWIPNLALMLQHAFDRFDRLTEKTLDIFITILQMYPQYAIQSITEADLAALESIAQHAEALKHEKVQEFAVTYLKANPRADLATTLAIIAQHAEALQHYDVRRLTETYLNTNPGADLKTTLAIIAQHAEALKNCYVRLFAETYFKEANPQADLATTLAIIAQHAEALQHENVREFAVTYLKINDGADFKTTLAIIAQHAKALQHYDVRRLTETYLNTNPGADLKTTLAIIAQHAEALKRNHANWFAYTYFKANPGADLATTLASIAPHAEMLKDYYVRSFTETYFKEANPGADLGTTLTIIAQHVEMLKDYYVRSFTETYFKANPRADLADTLQVLSIVSGNTSLFMNWVSTANHTSVDKAITQQLFDLSAIDFRDGGANRNTFEALWKGHVPQMQTPVAAPITTSIASAAKPIDLRECTFVKAVGRTLLFKQPGKTNLLAIKIPKRGEPIERLKREGDMCSYLQQQKEAWGLQSALPENPRMVSLKLAADHIKALQAQSSQPSHEFQWAGTQGETLQALCFEVAADYYEYLDENFSQEASDKALTDIAILMRNGLYPSEMTPLFHNLQDPKHPRAYVWNPQEVTAASNSSAQGPGRMHAAQEMAKFANFRRSGLADFKATFTQEELLTLHSKAQYFNELPGDTRNTIAVLSTMGDALLSWSLVLLNAWHHQKGAFDLAQELEHGFVTFYSTYAGLSREQALAELQLFVDFDRMAMQFAFFTTEEYLKEIYERDTLLPKHFTKLYGPHVHAQWQVLLGHRGWNPKHGWRYNGRDKDLGPVNGPFPIQELAKALYATTHLSLLHRTQSAALTEA